MKKLQSIARFLKIARVIGRYRLDELLPSSMQPIQLKLILAPFKLGRAPQLNRAERLRLALEELGPIFVKFGQLLSTRPDLIPPDLIIELNKLQDRVTPFDGEIFCALVEKALGHPLTDIFDEFDRQPLASASIAQVHTATLKNGDKVVVKAVRPNIEKTIVKDVGLMRLLAHILERYAPHGKRLKPIAVVEEYQQTIFDELDLMRETANASQLKRNFEQSPLLYVPNVYWPYCRRNVMVMERIYGAQVTDIATFNKEGIDLKVLAERGVEIFFTQVFRDNFFHADMHPGNVFVDISDAQSPSYIALDMAIMGSLDREDQYYLARNLLAMFRRDYRQVAELHVLSGWVPKSTSVGAFEAAIRAVCEPIFEKPLKEISFGEALITLFQTAQRFEMPVQPQLVLLQKTLLNIEGLGRQLYPDLDLWETAHPYLEKWLKERFAPKSLWKELKRQAPEWLEKFPEVPHLILETTQNMNQLAQIAPQLQNAASTTAHKNTQSQRQYFTKALVVLGVSTGVYFGWEQLHQLPAAAIACLAGSVVLWQLFK
ncbi:ubiquinone biosynthesis regulatory protein kinase UbiB [Marinagarivorans algicola]|uniref:ubiquinone biosynthesis regulatory protein kinase UbiB n=1 Tax=Marinagarivorans algicola TaxID=1513270 RepID=UPI0006B4B40B|nr:ubiquinone biosynthesis regulatory protein kinase UbiB [Marinagarivorans algicola]